MFLKGKSALITGSTSGIGLAYAKALAAEGADVMINGFGDADAIEAERAGIEAAGVRALHDPADMTDPAKPRKTANLATLGSLSPHESLLVNEKRGLLVGIMGTAATAPGILDVYDVKTDCRKPKLLSSGLTSMCT